MFVSLDYIFAPLLLLLAFGDVELKISIFYIFSKTYFWSNSSSFKEIQKINRDLLGKNLDVFQQNWKFFIANQNLILKTDVTLKSLSHAFF